ncbi:MAG TPA: alpha/beta hydrolase [Aggregatilineales bacterium]|nr:alpha/beta hydrolase [Aggregatilineales bacterium]
MNTITLNGIAVAHHILGDGVPVVMLHGWGASAELVLPLAKKLAPLGYATHVLDMPGHGNTSEPPVAWSVGDYAKLVVAYIHHHKFERVHLFGHSFGGRVSLILGAEYPQLIHKIVLADAAGIRPKTSQSKKIRLTAYKSVRDGLKTIGFRGLSDQLRNWYNKRYGSADFLATSGVMRETFVNVVNEDLSGYAKKIIAPTLLIWGENDQDTPLWQAKELERLIPDAGLVVYPNAGHYSYLEHPDQTAQAMHALFKAD